MFDCIFKSITAFAHCVRYYFSRMLDWDIWFHYDWTVRLLEKIPESWCDQCDQSDVQEDLLNR